MSQDRPKWKVGVVVPLDKRSDVELLALTRKDPSAFGPFYERHAKALLSYLARRTGDTEVALDLTAEVFAAALAASGRYRESEAPPRAWLFGIANKKLAASRRRSAIDQDARRRLGMRRIEFSEEGLERVEEELDASWAGYLRGMEKLSPVERMAVKARIIDERDYADIAAADATSEATIRQRVSRGLAKLERLGRRR
jgi:RNA polymerase sigma-70 factor, ECF subfamily